MKGINKKVAINQKNSCIFAPGQLNIGVKARKK